MHLTPELIRGMQTMHNLSTRTSFRRWWCGLTLGEQMHEVRLVRQRAAS